MTYPPPPGLVFLAYACRKITKEEFDYCMKLWKEKNKDEKEEEC